MAQSFILLISVRVNDTKDDTRLPAAALQAPGVMPLAPEVFFSFFFFGNRRLPVAPARMTALAHPPTGGSHLFRRAQDMRYSVLSPVRCLCWRPFVLLAGRAQRLDKSSARSLPTSRAGEPRPASPCIRRLETWPCRSPVFPAIFAADVAVILPGSRPPPCMQAAFHSAGESATTSQHMPSSPKTKKSAQAGGFWAQTKCIGM